MGSFSSRGGNLSCHTPPPKMGGGGAGGGAQGRRTAATARAPVLQRRLPLQECC